MEETGGLGILISFLSRMMLRNEISTFETPCFDNSINGAQSVN